MPKASIQDAPAGLCSRQQEPDHGKNKAVQQPNRATNKADSKKKSKKSWQAHRRHGLHWSSGRKTIVKGHHHDGCGQSTPAKRKWKVGVDNCAET
jgi:hypothetical protein